jgi:hypothetical protein
MKVFLISIIIFFGTISLAFTSDDDMACAYHSEYNGKKYSSEMPKSLLTKSDDFDLTNPKLPMPLNQIVDIAHSQLIKITGTKKEWDVSSISLNKWGQKEQKWYYAVSFEPTDYMSFAHITLVVTIDGQLGIVKQIDEKVID